MPIYMEEYDTSNIFLRHSNIFIPSYSNIRIEIIVTVTYFNTALLDSSLLNIGTTLS